MSSLQGTRPVDQLKKEKQKETRHREKHINTMQIYSELVEVSEAQMKTSYVLTTTNHLTSNLT